MKKISTVIIIAAFAWSIQACANRNTRIGDNRGDDTTNRTLDTTDMNRDTLEMQKRMEKGQ